MNFQITFAHLRLVSFRFLDQLRLLMFFRSLIVRPFDRRPTLDPSDHQHARAPDRPPSVSGSAAPGSAARWHQIPAEARWRFSSVMQLTCPNGRYHGPYFEDTTPAYPLLRLLAVAALNLLLVPRLARAGWLRWACLGCILATITLFTGAMLEVGMLMCNKRRPLSEIQQKFPHVDFTHLSGGDEDEVWDA